MKDSLVISEKFFSIQGEGQTMGIPAIFVRLSGCNILCQSENWICDTIEVWRKGFKTLFEDVLSEHEVNKLSDGAHLVFTGGEPLLHQDAIVQYCNWFYEKYEFYPVIEVETNGTIMPTSDMLKLVDYWNCSPKLSNSGESFERRVKIPVLETIQDVGKSCIFKFVINKYTDIDEIINDFSHHISKENAVLMPAGESQEKLQETRQMVADLCIKYGIRYSERLHIVIWNQKTGV